jgi:hypothetical protein
VIVSFDTQPEDQGSALAKIAAYVGDFLSQQPGFIESALYQSLDGTGIIHVAHWQSEADFQAAGEKARVHPDLPALMVFKPRGRGYRIGQRFQAMANAHENRRP